MIELSSVLPEDVITAAKYTVTLQETLMSIHPSTIKKSIETILQLPLIHSMEGIKNIANNILLTAQYRPFSISSLAKLSIGLNKAGQSNDNKLSQLKPIFLIIPVKILDEKWKVVFLYEGHKQRLFTDDELFSAIKKFFDEYPILKSKPFWKNNSRQHYLFFQWFAPLFEKMDKQLFEDTKNSFFECYNNHHLTSNYDSYMTNFEQLRANDWEEYKKLLNNHYIDGSIADIIKKDNVDELHKMLLKVSSTDSKKTHQIQFIQQKKTDDNSINSTDLQNLSPEEKQLRSIIDWRIESTMFEFITMLTRKPTLAHFAAFCGSEKCFTFLVEHGANLELNDYGKRNSLHFAIAGGNINIIHKVEEVVRDFIGATRIAAEYHRFDLFRILLDSSHANLKANDIENGSIFHGIAAANHIKMILFCLEQGCDCNLKDGDGWTPLNCAIDFRALESVYVISNIFNIDINAQDDYGIAPLIRATMNSDPDIVKVLIKHPKLEINSEGLYNQTALHRASQNNNIPIIKLLVEDPRINVNCVDHLNRTPLHFAAQNGSIEAIRTILSHSNVDLTIEDEEGILFFLFIKLLLIMLSKMEIKKPKIYSELVSKFIIIIKIIYIVSKRFLIFHNYL